VIAPAAWFSAEHGAELAEGINYHGCATYTSASRREYWGWTDSHHCTPAKLAEVFLEKFPELAKMGYGQDWVYGGWFQHMLHQTYPDWLPVAFGDCSSPEGHITLISESDNQDRRLALPPVGLAPARRSADRGGTK
jgi:hypothetical protein